MISIKQGRVAIALVCLVLGFMLAVQFRTTQNTKSTVSMQRVEDLSQRLNQMEKERDTLLEEVKLLRTSPTKQIVKKQLRDLKIASGISTVAGRGVVVSIDDSKKQAKVGENPNLYLIHDDDILKVINELRAAGAEAISINDQRLVSNSEIRCAGPTLSVNNTRSSPPYEIKAIGDPKSLESSLKMRGGVIETLQFWGIQISVSKEEDVVVPGYKGSFNYEYAVPVEGEKE